MKPTPTIDDLIRLLSELRVRDRGFKVFGADTHQYQNSPLSSVELREFELRLGVRLPEEFREFLLRVGTGAGPYYGILRPATIIKEQCLWHEDGVDALPEGICAGSGNPRLPFRSTRADLLLAATRTSTYGPYVPVHDAPDGVVKISHHGCTYWTLLVTSGECRGLVLDYCEQKREVVPAGLKFGSRSGKGAGESAAPLTFVEWYEDWLQTSLRQD